MEHPFAFTLEAEDPGTWARAGRFQTPHGPVLTPAFMPVGTKGVVKTVTPFEVREMGAQIVLGNTYHLYLRPGAEWIAEVGGLHAFSRWSGPMLTDSGGFQVFSLALRRRIFESGVEFRSHLDGSRHFFTPEKAIQVQELLGADIVMAFDECAPAEADRAYAREAMERTHRWLLRCIAAKERPDQALFGIVQGGVYPDLRRESARFVADQGLPGIAIGGLSVGEPKEVMWRMVETVVPLLPADRPRYLMGVGSPEDLIEGIARGIDLFDCVLPTRLGRTGAVFTPEGRINLRNAAFARDTRPIQEGCDCPACRHFDRAFLRHLFKEGETLGMRLATLHNLRFLLRLTAEARQAILEGRFEAFRRAFWERYRPVPEAARQAGREARRRARLAGRG